MPDVWPDFLGAGKREGGVEYTVVCTWRASFGEQVLSLSASINRKREPFRQMPVRCPRRREKHFRLCRLVGV